MRAMSPTIQKIVKAPFGENNNKYFIIFAPNEIVFSYSVVLSFGYSACSYSHNSEAVQEIRILISQMDFCICQATA